MTFRGQIRWSEDEGWWEVTDHYGVTWRVVELDGGYAILEREDSQAYYGATWCADAGGSDHGDIRELHDGEEYEGVDNRYRFNSMSGWEEVGADVSE